MALYCLHSVPVVHEYRAHLCSKASLFYVVCLALTLILPLIVAYRSQGFWKRTDWYVEQPEIRFKKKLIVWLELEDGVDYVAWSTFHHLNQLLESRLTIPLIQSREDDWNGDGVKDGLDLTIDFPLKSEETVRSATLILIFDYQLKKFSRLQMESMVYLQSSTASSGLQWKITADLCLKQKVPLPHAGLHTTYNASIINDESIFAEDYEIERILDNYSERNVTTVINNAYSLWKSGRGLNQSFQIRLKLGYPHELILYKPGFWQTVKWAWIQYFAILIVFLLSFNGIKTFIFKNQLLETVVKSTFKMRSL